MSFYCSVYKSLGDLTSCAVLMNSQKVLLKQLNSIAQKENTYDSIAVVVVVWQDSALFTSFQVEFQPAIF
jgi:hypothetical protein